MIPEGEMTDDEFPGHPANEASYTEYVGRTLGQFPQKTTLYVTVPSLQGPDHPLNYLQWASLN